MAYFDSPKNRVLWEMELKDLRKQKADFEAGRLHDYAGGRRAQAAGYGKKRPEGFGEEPGRAGAAKGAGAQIQQCKGQVMRI